MATLVNKMNREVKVIIPNMREFRSFYSDNEGVIGMFLKRDWEEVKQDEHWKPSEDQMEALLNIEGDLRAFQYNDKAKIIAELYEQLKRL